MKFRLVHPAQQWSREFEAASPEALARACCAGLAQYRFDMRARELDRDRPRMRRWWFTPDRSLELHLQDPQRPDYWVAVGESVVRARKQLGLPCGEISPRSRIDLLVSSETSDWQAIWIGCDALARHVQNLATLSTWIASPLRRPPALRIVAENGCRT